MRIYQSQKLNLREKSVVFIDWANVYGWHLRVEPKTLFKYLKKHSQIELINFYFGTDNNEKSQNFIKQMQKIGYIVNTKAVKYIVVGKVANTLIIKRKCDFDIEICMSVYDCLTKDYQSFIFFSGDGDLAPIYKYLIEKGKQVIVVFEKGHVGREVWEIKKGLFKTRLSYLNIDKKIIPQK